MREEIFTAGFGKIVRIGVFKENFIFFSLSRQAKN
jgi:hypothetical protein